MPERVVTTGSRVRHHLLLLGAGLIALIVAADVHEACRTTARAWSAAAPDVDL